MPSLQWNKQLWDGKFDWSRMGEQWSAAWGGSEAQWFASIYPRIHRFIPSAKILEIAPGFGRWTRFLIGMCDDYIGVDLSEHCVSHCQAAFKKGKFLANDGLSLDMIEDSTVDFCFSFDSLVHAEMNILESYVPQVLQKLTKDGVAFVHHSNLLDCNCTGENRHNRALTVSSRRIKELVVRCGGEVLIQENINWGRTPHLTDGFTLFRHPKRMSGSGAPMLLSNEKFMEEAEYVKNILACYTRT